MTRPFIHPLTFAQLERAVAEWAALRGVDIKVTASTGGGSYTVRATAPDGYVWASDAVHELVESTGWPGPAKWRHQTHGDLWARIALGLENCPDADSCEWCCPLTAEDL